MNENQNYDTRTGLALASHRMPYSLLNTCETIKAAGFQCIILEMALKRTLHN